MPLADASVWADGARVAHVPVDLLHETAAERGGFAWFDLVDPTEDELRAAAAELELHSLVVEDIAQRGQRPKLEPYDRTVYCVVHRIRPGSDESSTEEVHAIVGPSSVVTVSWGDAAGLGEVRRRVEEAQERLPRTPIAVLHALLDEAADGHADRTDAARERIAQLEEAFFGEGDPQTVEVYRTMREVLAISRAAEPMSPIVERLLARLPDAELELRRHLRDVDDHARRTSARLQGAQRLLTGLLQLAAARVAERQNEEIRAMTEQQIVQNDQTKKVTSWAAILFAPTLVAGIYGMNFRHMPELHWLLGYPFAIVLMLLFAGVLYVVFKRRHWL
ncbi:magnesium and cobalt transport protein CorA [Agrococcus carbonis]|uniref:Magnesium transporter n=1 Tax=Agrococcus carbonis TaxID=684552 RepID=A0A1H1LQU8_9MICO|nr:magnesium and cobalt transport protein CorA [Agrococcus carbonis]SDR76958.1 magnesium transporter [Agrococcus carbonis]